MSSTRIRCRQIESRDLEAVADLLTQGFPSRSRKYWTKAIEALGGRERLEGCPEFGYLLEADGVVVGVHLLIFNRIGEGAKAQIRCNTSSWYVAESYRGHAALLAAIASKLKHVTYLNTSAAVHTWPILDALGYRRYSQGQFVSIPALSRSPKAKVRVLCDCPAHRALADYQLLSEHAEKGCLVLICESADGLDPFVFLRRQIRYAPIGVMQLIFCRDSQRFVDCAGPLGRFLLRHRASCVISEADGPVKGLFGCFFKDKTPRFFKGPDRPRQNDLAFTEMVLFGP